MKERKKKEERKFKKEGRGTIEGSQRVCVEKIEEGLWEGRELIRGYRESEGVY